MAHAATLETNESARLLAALRRLEDALIGFAPDKPEAVKATLAAVMSHGHLLLEDVPGVGKTTFVRLVARLLGLGMKRIQFTADLLPADIIGIETFDQAQQAFRFHEGPIFSHIVLADEINRSSPRTQSALLEAMGEGSVTVDRATRPLPDPFLVIATQNPADNIGTYPLPESQLDRFSARVRLDYPSRQKEVAILQTLQRDPLSAFPSDIMSAGDVRDVRTLVESVHMSERVAQTAYLVIHGTRTHPKIRHGVSTRGGVLWGRMARAYAFLAGRDYVVPDDLFALAPACLAHRIVPVAGHQAHELVGEVVASVTVV